MATTAVQVQQTTPLVIAQHPIVQQAPVNSGPVRGLAITQLLIGILTGVLGVAGILSLYANTWTTKTGAGIWAGGWIALTGLIGVCSAQNRTGLNGVYLAFSIISTCVSALAGLFFIVAVSFYALSSRCREYDGPDEYTDYWENDCSYRNVGLGLHVPLLLLMIIEFFVSIVAEVYCCKNGCGQQTQGMVISQQPYIPVVTHAGGPTTGGYVTNVQYPPQMAPQFVGQAAPQYGGQAAPQYGGQAAPQYGGQMAPQYGMQMQPQYNPQHVPPPYDAQMGGVQAPYPVQQTNVTYSEKPPDYK